MQKLAQNVELMVSEWHPEDDTISYWTTHKFGALLLIEDKNGASITAFDDNGDVLSEGLYAAESSAKVHELLGNVFSAKDDDYAAISDDYAASMRDFNKLWL